MPNTTLIKILRELPEKIHYCGYTFILSFSREFGFVGYYLFSVNHKNKKKKEAFKLGIWYEKRHKYRLESVETNCLCKVPYQCDDDIELYWQLDLLINLLEKYKKIGLLIAPPSVEKPETIDTDFIEIKQLFLN